MENVSRLHKKWRGVAIRDPSPFSFVTIVTKDSPFFLSRPFILERKAIMSKMSAGDTTINKED